LKENKELIAFGDQLDGASSDSCPSEDNLDEEDIASILPQPSKQKKPPLEKKPSKKPAQKRQTTAKKAATVIKRKNTP